MVYWIELKRDVIISFQSLNKSWFTTKEEQLNFPLLFFFSTNAHLLVNGKIDLAPGLVIDKLGEKRIMP
jgi:hypothetical protein